MRLAPASSLSRRQLLVAATAAASALALAACGSSSSSTASSSDSGLSGTVVWADYGGPTHKSRDKVFLTPFQKETGVKVTSTTIADAVLARMLSGGTGDYDVVQAGVYDIYNHKDDLVALPSGTGTNDVLPADIRQYALGTFGVGQAQGYLPATFPDGGPQSWADFWDFTKFPGKRAIPGVPASFDYMFEAALLADGVAPDKLYPMDLTRAVKKLDQLKGHVVFYTEYPQVQQLLASKSASIAFSPTGQYAGLRAAGTDVSVTWNQALLAWNVFVIPKGAKNQKNAIALAKDFTDPKKQAAFAELTNYAPGNQDALQYVPEKTMANLPTAEANQGKVIDVDDVARAKQYDDCLKAYGDWLAAAK
ncbi:extracellular solute-binding protein [Cryptosporangium sp. NPDC051539]|uniref:extracellular solute-binding protein n=1 Tax=Cryptosporangium sp. NPDC051539 TaxID=3363962 RepID=UPI0037A5BBCA